MCRHGHITLQVVPLQEAAAGAQQSSIQHLTVTNNANDTQQGEHQSTVQYTLPNKKVARNKHQEVATYIYKYLLSVIVIDQLTNYTEINFSELFVQQRSQKI